MDHILLTLIFLIFDDESLPTINKPKHSKEKGEYEEQNGRTHIQERQMNHLRGQTNKGNIKFLDPLRFLQEAYQIMKGEDLLKGGLASLEKPSPSATAHLKIEIEAAHTL